MPGVFVPVQLGKFFTFCGMKGGHLPFEEYFSKKSNGGMNLSILLRLYDWLAGTILF